MASNETPKLQRWIGWGLTGLFVAFMIFDTSIKLMRLEIVKTTLVEMGFPPHLGLVIGIVEAICLALYLIPRASVLGAVLFTAVMGGAIASHMRQEAPLLSRTLFGVYLGLFMWGGLFLRDARLRSLFPIRR